MRSLTWWDSPAGEPFRHYRVSGVPLIRILPGRAGEYGITDRAHLFIGTKLVHTFYVVESASDRWMFCWVLLDDAPTIELAAVRPDETYDEWNTRVNGAPRRDSWFDGPFTHPSLRRPHTDDAPTVEIIPPCYDCGRPYTQRDSLGRCEYCGAP